MSERRHTEENGSMDMMQSPEENGGTDMMQSMEENGSMDVKKVWKRITVWK